MCVNSIVTGVAFWPIGVVWVLTKYFLFLSTIAIDILSSIWSNKSSLIKYNFNLSIYLTGVMIHFENPITAKSCKKVAKRFLTGVELHFYVGNRNMTCKNFFKFCSSKSYHTTKIATVSSGIFLFGENIVCKVYVESVFYRGKYLVYLGVFWYIFVFNLSCFISAGSIGSYLYYTPFL